MCGIWGVMNHHVEQELANYCVDKLTHRGPDGRGLTYFENWSLGHRRLSILDLSEKGKQPMSYAGGRYWITYNGEIYNFIEIRNELEKKGYKFYTNTDTEVILASYMEWGEDCQLRFNGMWAFGIWDVEEKSLFLSRDRFGVKPLFYHVFKDGGICFASEMKAIIPVMESVCANNNLIEKFFLNPYYEDEEQCLILGIERLRGGECARYKNGIFDKMTWWNTLDHLENDVPSNYHEQVEILRSLFLDACKIRMRSDVVLGTALSGGLDSTATICAMSLLAGTDSDERMNKDFQHAFIATFPGTEQDETKYASSVTSYLNIPANFLKVDDKLDPNDIYRDAYLLEELWTAPQSPMIQIYKEERKNGVTVSLDGHGADELFGGYGFDIVRAYTDCGLNLRSIHQITKAWMQLDEYSEKPSSIRYITTMARKYLGTNYWNVRNPLKVRSLYSSHPIWNSIDNLNKKLYIETHDKVLPTLLRNYDRTSMANGVEIRMPFLDYRIVQFAFSIGWKSKVRNGYSKAIVRDAIADFAPKNIVYRSSKIGFNSPLLSWLRGNGREFFEDTIFSHEFRNSSFVRNVNKVEEDFKFCLKDDNATLVDAFNLWTEMQPYIWSKAFQL